MTRKTEKTRMTRKTAEWGAALVIALMIMGILLLLGTAFLTISSTESQIAFNERSAIQALHLADAGVHWAISQLNADPDFDADNRSLGPGAFTVTVVSEAGGSPDRKLIQSTGSVSNGSSSASAQSVVMVSVDRTSPFQWPLFGKESLTLDKEVETDSYDSAQGAYGADLGGGVENKGENGDVGSNGDVLLKDEVAVHGDATAGGSVELQGDVQVTGTITSSAPPALFNGIDASYNASNSNETGITASEGGYNYDPTTHDLTIEKESVITFAPGTYYFNNVTIGKEVRLNVGGEVTIYVTGVFHVGKESRIGVDQPPTNLSIYSSFSSTETNGVEIKKEVEFSGTIYAIDAPVKIDKEVRFFGAVIGRSIKVDNEAEIHYDEAVSRRYSPAGRFKPVAGTWRELIPLL